MADETKPPASSTTTKGSGLGKYVMPVAVLGGVGLLGWWAYSRFAAGQIDAAEQIPQKAAGPQPNLKGPRVFKKELASTKSTACISQPDPRMKYAKVISLGASNYKNFQSPVAGHFTGRLLCQGGVSWAEIYPHV